MTNPTGHLEPEIVSLRERAQALELRQVQLLKDVCKQHEVMLTSDQELSHQLSLLQHQHNALENWRHEITPLLERVAAQMARMERTQAIYELSAEILKIAVPTIAVAIAAIKILNPQFAKLIGF